MRKACCMLALVLAIVGCQGSRTVEKTVTPDALSAILPTQGDVRGHMPGGELSRENDYVCAAFNNSPEFLAGREQHWVAGDSSTELSVIVAIFSSAQAAESVHERWTVLRSLPWYPVERDPIGDKCRFQPQGGWHIEYFKENVYVKVGTRPGNEPLTRTAAQDIESKIQAVINR